MKPILGRYKKTIIFLTSLLGVGLFTAVGLIYIGFYNVSALTPHTHLVYKTLEYARVRSVAIRSPEDMTDLDDIDWQMQGVRLYRKYCTQCHGAPGVAPASFSLGMMPPPSSIVKVARQRTAGEIYWVIKNGIKMSGMPAWDYRLNEQEMLELTALVAKLPYFTVDEYKILVENAIKSASENTNDSRPPKDYQKILQSAEFKEDKNFPAADIKVELGIVALQQYNCSSCHIIPGMPSASNRVGPPLGNLMQRQFIAGTLPTTRENAIKWIRNPQHFKPNSTMPNLSVKEEHAKQMVTYFEILSQNR